MSAKNNKPDKQLDVYKYLEGCTETLFIPGAGIIIMKILCESHYTYLSNCSENKEEFNNAEARISQMDPNGKIEEAVVERFKHMISDITKMHSCNTDKGHIITDLVGILTIRP